MPSKWENCAHNGLICFFQHNYISTFEQWLWDRVWVLAPGLVIFEAVEGTFVHFTKGHDHFNSNSICCGCLRKDQCNIACLRSCIQKCTGNIGHRHSARRQRIAPFDLRRASLPVAIAICYNVSWYTAHRVWYSFAAEFHDFPHW